MWLANELHASPHYSTLCADLKSFVWPAQTDCKDSEDQFCLSVIEDSECFPVHIYILPMTSELPQKRFTLKVAKFYLRLHLCLGTLLQFLKNQPKFILSIQLGHEQ